MNVYHLDNMVEVYQSLRPASVIDRKTLRTFDGAQKAATWGPTEVRLFRESDFFEGKLPSDFPYLAPGVPVFSATAITVLRDLLEPHGEILSLLCDDGDYLAFNVTRLLDALNLERSQIQYFSDGSVMDVQQYEFIAERLMGVPIFKLPQLAVSDVFVTDAFVQRVQDCGLTGFLFRPVWSDE